MWTFFVDFVDRKTFSDYSFKRGCSTVETFELVLGSCTNHVDTWGGVSRMSTLVHKFNLVKVSAKEGGGGLKIPQILSTWFAHAPFGPIFSSYITKSALFGVNRLPQVLISFDPFRMKKLRLVAIKINTFDINHINPKRTQLTTGNKTIRKLSRSKIYDFLILNLELFHSTLL